jgi:hypothetical protein
MASLKELFDYLKSSFFFFSIERKKYPKLSPQTYLFTTFFLPFFKGVKQQKTGS